MAQHFVEFFANIWPKFSFLSRFSVSFYSPLPALVQGLAAIREMTRVKEWA